MARPKSKNELLEQAQVNFDKLWKLIDSMSAQALKTDFDFSNDAKKKNYTGLGIRTSEMC
ncbi:ClbS/DfsB family four-helix bundle protein [Leucothrix pacifica]|uniref:ClbS/DfsB family four-helix bundle protein n=1 Tax=Leucothrix pacifica TaxID=1247513 RepID=UPI001FEC28B4